MPPEPDSPLDRLTWPICTERLLLRRARPEDGDTVLAYRRLPQVADGLASTFSDPQVWESAWERRLPMTIIVELQRRTIGDLRLMWGEPVAQQEVIAQAAHTEAEIAWAFDPDFHGQGFATEAVARLIGVAFSELAVRRLIADCFADNEPSWRLMERVGMRRETHSVRSALHRDGVWKDFLIYGILAPGAERD
jgi:RimJ/RimL family protein N-acetyltransferase